MVQKPRRHPKSQISCAVHGKALGGLDEALPLSVLDAKGLAIRCDGLDISEAMDGMT